MSEILRAHAESQPDRIALADEQGVTNWGALDARVNRLIDALRRTGLGAGATVALLAGNRRESFELFEACAHAGLVAVPINWHFHAEEVEYVLRDCAAAACFVGHRLLDLGAVACERAGVALRVAIGAEPPPEFVAYEDLLAGASDAEPDDQTQGGVMFYTSGTTGRPKGVRRTSGLGEPVTGQQMRAQGFAAMIGMPIGGVTLVCGPVYHSAQWAFSQFPLDLGGTLVLRHKFDPAETLELIDRHRVTNVHLVPTQMKRLLRLDEKTRRAFDGSSLELVLHGAAPCPPGTKRAMIEWWGPVLSEYYGGTEGAVVSVITAREWLERPTSVGRPLPMVEIQVLDRDGKACDPGTPGQLYIRSLMAQDFEYHGDPEKTASVHREPGLFTMGDIGFLDGDGYLHLTDREIDMIISGGVNIYPAEIEQTLADHPAVADVAVFGVPDEEYGERVQAVVVLSAANEPSPELERALIAHCREHLAGYKAPRSVAFTDQLPRQETGKLFKRALRERYWEGRERPI